MLSLPFPTFGLGDADILPIQQVYDLVKEKYAAAYEPDLSFPFNEFELFHYYVSFSTGPAIRLANGAGNFYVTFPQVTFTCTNGRYADSRFNENETWGIAYLKKNFGHILIKPETLLDRIHDLINPIDIHFE